MKNKNQTLTALAENLEIDTDLLKEVLILFFENLPRQINDIRRDVQEEDFESVHVISHTLKGTAANLHYTDISKTAADIEKLALAHHLESASYDKLLNKLSLQLAHAKMQIFYQ